MRGGVEPPAYYHSRLTDDAEVAEAYERYGRLVADLERARRVGRKGDATRGDVDG